MMKIILTKHVKERRKKGHIPEDKLRMLCRYLTETHSLSDKDDGLYKFRSGPACAVISKKNNTAVFVTFFGSTGWLIDTDKKDLSEFSCVYQGKDSNDRKRLKKEGKIQKDKSEKKDRVQSKLNRFINADTSLKRLSNNHKKLLKRGTFEVVELDIDTRVKLRENIGRAPAFLFISKHDNYNFIDVLGIDGTKIKTMTKQVYLSVV